MTSWLPIVGVPAAWLLQSLVVWLVAEWSCPGGGSGTRGIVIGVSAAALALALTGVAGALAAWWRSGNRGLLRVSGETQTDFTAACALFVSTSFALAIVANTAPAFLGSVCEAIR